uniref:Uncharacterized protein n=1 Tax=Leersia perrieri TaxID=77586 RepID=A0A0D9W3E1_9ORYZ
MLCTVGPELQVVNKSEAASSLVENGTVFLTPDQRQDASSKLLTRGRLLSQVPQYLYQNSDVGGKTYIYMYQQFAQLNLPIPFIFK